MSESNPTLERWYVHPRDKLSLDMFKRQLSIMLGRRLSQADFAELIVKHGERIRDVIAENEKVKEPDA